MSDRQDELVRIDSTGTAHPVGRTASRELRQRQGAMRVLPSPASVLVLRTAEKADIEPFWMGGEIVRAGSLWDLIGMIGQGNWTGELTVADDDDNTRRLVFDAGHVIGAFSTADRERLGEVLYQYGALSEDQIQLVLQASTPDVRFGEAAVALGFLSREKLFELISRQAEEVVYATMVVSSGSFYFVDGYNEMALPYRLNLSVTSLMMEGVRRMDEMGCFRARIPSSLHVPVHIQGAAVAPNHEHAQVFMAIDGQRSIEDIGRLLGQGQFDVTRGVFHLLQEGKIHVGAPRPTGPEAIVQLFNQAIALVMRKVDEVGGGREVREQLASFATASGVYDALFRDAGPLADGTLIPDKIADNIDLLVGGDDASSMLAQWLYEYASFAMFIAEPLLRSRVAATALGEPAASEGAQVSRQVAELLKPLAPDG